MSDSSFADPHRADTVPPLPGPSSIDPRLAGLHRSATLAIQARTNARLARGQEGYKLGLGQSPYPVPSALVAALRAHAAEKDYLPVEGLPALRRAVADYHQRRHGVQRHEDDLIVGPGSKQLMFLLQVAFDGELLVPAPSWVSYAPQAQLAGRSVRWIPTRLADGLRLDPQILDESLRALGPRPRILVLNYPSNPVGTSYDAATLQHLAAVARRHGLIVLSDEIYAELTFAGDHVSIARYYEEGTILATGLSKWCGAGGWRLGTFSFPERLRWLLEAALVVASETHSSTAAPIQHAAITAFRDRAGLEPYLQSSRRISEGLARYAERTLAAVGAQVPSPAGGFYLFPTFSARARALANRGIGDDVTLAERVLDETGVATLPGSVFGMPSSALHLRLALVDFDGARALVAAEDGRAIDDGFVSLHCPRTVAAVAALAAWMG